jgi:hypothetical protein
MKPAESQIQERVDRLFDRFERMTDAELMILRSVWDAQLPSAREEAWTMVKVALRQHRRDGLLTDARNRIAAWVNNYSYRLAFPDTLGAASLSGMDQGSIRKAAIPPMLDAIAATIAADGLSPSEQTLLLEPLAALAPHTSPG